MNERRDLWWESPTIELAKVIRLDLGEPFAAVHGGELPEIQVSYESWGELNAQRDNVVLVIHPMTADCHVTGEHLGQPLGWWEPLIGPGRAIDTDRHFVVCPNLIGGCFGTTGPRFPAPDGQPYLDRFPLLTPRDMMRVQRRFLDALGVKRVNVAIGPSMGGMIAWEWAIEGSDLVDWVVVVAAPLRTSPHQIGLNWLQRRGIELDITENEVVAKQGQMIARGVGMLSYRSPVGLEEKFGREWFTRPGATLKDRGMFNVESWLRHHGRRITKRFDPFTYMLFSRAMDLHDVTMERGDLVTALNAIECSVLVVGISSDYLYPSDEVHFGADVLNHLGRRIRYREIRSPNGHDAFLLDTDQLATFLRQLHVDEPGAVTARVERSVRPVGVGILGAGKVATSFVRLIKERRGQLIDSHGLDLDIRGVAEINREKWLDPIYGDVNVVFDPEVFVAGNNFDVLVDLTRGLGSHDLVERALGNRRHVVTPNKILLRAHGDDLDRLALDRGVRLAYHDSIAAGWPLIYALERPLARGSVCEVHAMLSSACNVMLALMEEGASFGRALRLAIERELTEPDPRLDTSGWDTAQKLGILLARVTGRRYTARDIETTGIDGIDPEWVRAAPRANVRVKLGALAVRRGDELQAVVRPLAVPGESHLGLVRDLNHVVVLRDSDGGESVHFGSGSGALPVATAVLNDLIGLFDPRRSWTGRFPPAERALSAPSFRQWFTLRDGKPSISEKPGRGAIPVADVLDQGPPV